MPTRSVRRQIRRDIEKRWPGGWFAFGLPFYLDATGLVESGRLHLRIVDRNRLSARFHAGTMNAG